LTNKYISKTKGKKQLACKRGALLASLYSINDAMNSVTCYRSWSMSPLSDSPFFRQKFLAILDLNTRPRHRLGKPAVKLLNLGCVTSPDSFNIQLRFCTAVQR